MKKQLKPSKNVLNINPKNINSLLNLGKIYSQLGRFKDSENYYIKVLEIESNNFSALYELIKINKKTHKSSRLKMSTITIIKIILTTFMLILFLLKMLNIKKIIKRN